MSVQALTQFHPTEFFRLPSANGTGAQRLDTKVRGVAVSNDFSGRLSVTTTEGDTIILSANIESDFRAVNYKARAEGDGTTVDVDAKYAEYSLTQEFGVTVEGDLNEQEVEDLEKLFRTVVDIFKKFLIGQDDEVLAKTANLAERFGALSSLSGLDVRVDVERSITVLAAQLASEVTGQPALPTGQQLQIPASTSHTATPGEAPSAVAAIPRPSTGTTASHISTPPQETQSPRSLVQQVLDALKEAKVESHKVRKYLPDFFEKLREDLGKELRGERNHDQPANQVQTPGATSASVVFAHQSVSQTSISLSIRS